MADASTLRPADVHARLEALRRLWVPMDAAEADRLMTPPAEPVAFEEAVRRRLDELRALIELTRELHRRR